MNPVPVDVKPRVLSTEIDFGDAAASLDLAMKVAGYFELSGGEAEEVIAEVKAAVSSWPKAAEKAGISPREIARMATAFELAGH